MEYPWLRVFFPFDKKAAKRFSLCFTTELSASGDIVDARVYTYAATLHQCQHRGQDVDLEQQKGLFKK